MRVPARVRFVMVCPPDRSSGCERPQPACAADRVFDGAVRRALHTAFAPSGAQLESPRVNRSLPSRISLASSNGRGAGRHRLWVRIVGRRARFSHPSVAGIVVTVPRRWRRACQRSGGARD